MAEAAPDLGIMIFIAFIVVGGVLIWYFMKNKKPKDYKVRPFQEQNFNELMRTVNRCGQPGRGGKLFLGFQRVAIITRFYNYAGKLESMIHDGKKRNYRQPKPDEKQDQPYEAILFKAHPQNYFLRQLNKIFGWWFELFLIDAGRITMYDPIAKRWFLPQKEPLNSFGNVWFNGDVAQEIMSDLALKRVTEETLTMAENLGPRVMYLETQTARFANKLFTDSKAVKDKYDAVKTADDQNIVT